MNKLHLLKQAENLYCIENFTPDMIAEKLNISRRTIFNWKKQYKWNNHIVKIKDFSNQFATEIYSVGAKILSKLNDDIDNKRLLNKHEICALENIIKIINKKEKEQTNTKVKITNNTKLLTNERIEKICEEFSKYTIRQNFH
ncbi:MAG: helix-turn-helix domain-containing protein [Candidatus Gastranaerophilales bacterium]|nr:helix-turn-helix domain-containing protein [Candidatus Gastranaerophilales bacterium]